MLFVFQAQEDAAAQTNYNVPISGVDVRFLQQLKDLEGHINDSLQKIQSNEDEMALAMAMSFMPLEQMSLAAEENVQLQRLFPDSESLAGLKAVSPACALLEELLRWFKQDFFTWVDHPLCDYCAFGTKLLQIEPASTEERADGGAGRTEVYKCPRCTNLTRFPRYNSALKLLETRRGRCGEWANCFALCCRAAGLPVRLVWDSTDHIWVEIFSEEEGRWIHTDPCEALYDKPLLYEKGWGKKLEYIVAVGVDHVEDVTSKYTADIDQIASRQPVPISMVHNLIDSINARIQTRLSNQEKEMLKERSKKDKIWMENARLTGRGAIQEEELQARTTGSQEWIQKRGEGGSESNREQITTGKKKKFSSTRYRWVDEQSVNHGHRLVGGASRASGENPPHELSTCVFDGKKDTKWLDFGGKEINNAWIEYRLLPTSTPVHIKSYALTSANDEPARDPKHVVMECWDNALNDWITVDEQKDVSFDSRGQTISFSLNTSVQTKRCRLRIVSVRDPEQANSVQLSCWDIFIEK